MLAYVVFYNLLKDKTISGIEIGTEKGFEHIHDLYAAFISWGISRLIQRGLCGGYVQKEDKLNTVRGKILISETIRGLDFLQGQMTCAYDEFIDDNPINQALKSVIVLLLKHSDVNKENKIPLRKSLCYFSHVTDIHPAGINWRNINSHSKDILYQTILSLCELCVKSLLLTTSESSDLPKTVKTKDWSSIYNKKDYNKLYEDFVAAFYKLHYKNTKTEVKSQALINWITTPEMQESITHNGEEVRDLLGRMKPDVILLNEDTCIILDTKWYKEILKNRNYPGSNYPGSNKLDDSENDEDDYENHLVDSFEEKESQSVQNNGNESKLRFAQGNLYQMFAYVKNFPQIYNKKEYENYKDAKIVGILLYAQTDKTRGKAKYEIGGNIIMVKTLNLNRDWCAIEEELKNIFKWVDHV
jgi:5-methylcytosine-specific restriction enzyme subunit McrC